MVHLGEVVPNVQAKLHPLANGEFELRKYVARSHLTFLTVPYLTLLTLP